MIASIRGQVISRAEDSLVVEVGGVGFLVHAAPAFCRTAEAGETVFLHTFLVVREDALLLYGFETEELRNKWLKSQGRSSSSPFSDRIGDTALPSRGILHNEALDRLTRWPRCYTIHCRTPLEL